jgi:hypothetical protein
VGAIEKRKSGEAAKTKSDAESAQMERLIGAVRGGAEKTGGNDKPET